MMTETDNQAFDQSSSPLMMFGEDEEKVPDSFDSRLNTITATSSSQVGRGNLGKGIAEDAETDTTPINSEYELTLQNFREALVTNPDAPRFIIVRNGDTASIQPAEVANGNRDENLTIIYAIRDALEQEYSSERRALVSQVIGQNNLRSYGKSHLSATRLHEILRRSVSANYSQDGPTLQHFKQAKEFLFFKEEYSLIEEFVFSEAVIKPKPTTWWTSSSLSRKDLKKALDYKYAEESVFIKDLRGRGVDPIFRPKVR